MSVARIYEQMFVPLENIEQPVNLNGYCALLMHGRINHLLHTEEEAAEFLEEALQDESTLPICLGGICGEFCREFARGETPYSGRKPVVLAGCRGKYYALQGRHRVCLAKRIKVSYIRAFVRETGKDYSLLPEKGQPGIFIGEYSFVDAKRPRNIEGNVFALWIPEGRMPAGFDPFFLVLDAATDTGGKWLEVIPGVKYSVAVRQEKQRYKSWRSVEKVIVRAEVKIDGSHKKTKIWLLQVPGKEVPKAMAEAVGYITLYRCGRWRGHHKELLGRGGLKSRFYVQPERVF